MLFPTVVLALSSAWLAAAAPTRRSAPAAVTDTSIMQYALTLEHIEHAFYVQGLGQYDAQAFCDAGYEPWVRGRFAQIREHERTHVEFLTSQLGADAPAPCNYSYPYTDIPSFVALSQTLEEVGAAAYMGAAISVESQDVLSAALAISHIEARQAGWVSSALQKEQPWDGDYETPLYFSGVWSLASGFITSCPATNPDLPVQAFPALTLTPAAPVMGQNVSVSYNSTGAPVSANGTTWLAWYHDMNTTFTAIGPDGITTVPDGLRGTVFAGVVSNTTVTRDDATMLSGLAALSFPYSSYAVVGA
ncbi:ferritin-like domain-containing protein [Fomitopsis serialis]|uniref:ferritin-like domain-containing protein n=1 Tax=Fomitopsis serialis TaxID=139415 RepID=UPI002007268A|nr:ferritin-like domain-containing protein [Neoantrodia serialis]KAH9912571.1 ferritin-like domain-containing protein [Neoantrodia serialis]